MSPFILNAFSHLLWFTNVLVLLYFLLLNSTYLLTCLLALGYLRRYQWRLKLLNTTELLGLVSAPPISIIAPAYNEEATCVQSIRSLLNLEYPNYEILVVNDGSKDKTMEKLHAAFELQEMAIVPMAQLKTAAVKHMYRSQSHPQLWVIDKENGGKADALNTGLNFCRNSLFCAIDADTLIERDALLRLVRPFLENRTTIASGGMIRIVNDCKVHNGQVKEIKMPRNLWARIQVVEYLRAFLIARVGWSSLNALLIISGAFGLFKRSLAVDIGGYDKTTVGEDMELVVRMHKHCRANKIPYRIDFVSDPAAWTECPESLKILGRQRERWQRGLTEVMLKHIKMLFNPRFGMIGGLIFPYFFFLETLGVLLEFVGYFSFLITLLMGNLSYEFMLAFCLVAILYGLMISFFSLYLEAQVFHRYHRISDFFQMVFMSVFENFGYRQLASYWRFKGTFKTLLGMKGHWGKMERKGFAAEEVPKST